MKLFKKGFDIELEDSLTYPSSEKICEAIEKYCIDNKQNSEFVSRSNPVTFKLEGIHYKTIVKMARGGFCLFCKEI